MCGTTSLFFFFQAEDGIRDDLVTGVQTCALPICKLLGGSEEELRNYATSAHYFDYKIADRQGNIDGRQGVRLGAAGVELLEVFKPKAQEEKKAIDRKSTRLNSSHQIISYAVFCLK